MQGFVEPTAYAYFFAEPLLRVGLGAEGALYPLDLHQRVEQHIDHADARYLHADGAHHRAILARGEGDGAEAELQLTGDHLRDAPHDTGLILRHDGYRDAEGAVGLGTPPCLDDAVGVVLLQALGVGAVAAVDGDARADGDEAEDVVAFDRVAALG